MKSVNTVVCDVRMSCGECVSCVCVVRVDKMMVVKDGVELAQRDWQKKPLKGANRFWKPWPETVAATVMPSCSALEMVRLLVGASSEPKSWNWDRVTSNESHTFHSNCSDLSWPLWIAAFLKLAVVSLGEP